MMDVWPREMGLNTELRKWLGHDVKRWPKFRERNLSARKFPGGLIEAIKDAARNRP